MDPLPLAQDLRERLSTGRFGRGLRAFHSAPSTNTLAMAWAHEGAREGSVVIADYQSAGRGRQGRQWEASAGQNLLFSVVLRPRLRPAQLNLITLAASLAIAEGIDAVAAPLQASIKWPNDILLEERKCCGMLLESTLSPPTAATVVLGIGINVNQHLFSPELEGQATSLLLETGRQVPRSALLADLLSRLESWYDALHQDQESVRGAYTARLHGLGLKRIVHRGPRAALLAGAVLGVTDAGALRLKTLHGEQVIHVGDVTRPEHGRKNHGPCG